MATGEADSGNGRRRPASRVQTGTAGAGVLEPPEAHLTSALEGLERLALGAVGVTANALLAAAGPELTFLAWRAIVELDEAGHPVRLSDLADRLHLSRPSASKLVRRLERRGLVELSPNPEDGRGLLLALSERGHAIRDDVIAQRRAILIQALEAPLPSGFEEALTVVAARLARST